MNIELYTVNYCPYCKKALAFLNERNVEYKNYDITLNEEQMRAELGKKYNIKGRVTVPQILIDGKNIGGYTDMINLYSSGELKFE